MKKIIALCITIVFFVILTLLYIGIITGNDKLTFISFLCILVPAGVALLVATFIGIYNTIKA